MIQDTTGRVALLVHLTRRFDGALEGIMHLKSSTLRDRAHHFLRD